MNSERLHGGDLDAPGAAFDVIGVILEEVAPPVRHR
jgi:hypothetical protein